MNKNYRTENISLVIVRNVNYYYRKFLRLNLSGKSLLRQNCKYNEYETHVNNGSTFVRKYNDVLLLEFLFLYS